jgi:hypothetical protein
MIDDGDLNVFKLIMTNLKNCHTFFLYASDKVLTQREPGRNIGDNPLEKRLNGVAALESKHSKAMYNKAKSLHKVHYIDAADKTKKDVLNAVVVAMT